MGTVRDRSSVVADTIHGQIYTSTFEKDVIGTTLFNRLHGVHQNSTAFMTFPANRTKRLEHSFGTMYLCGKIFSSAICNAVDPTLSQFFEKAESEVQKSLKEIQSNSIYSSKLGQIVRKIPTSYKELHICGGIYDRILPSNVKESDRKIFLIIFESIRISALLHDIGHPPFSHITEFALNHVYQKVIYENWNNSRVREFKEIAGSLFAEKQELHEEMGKRIAKTLLKESIKDIDSQQARDSDRYAKQLFYIIIAETVQKIFDSKDTFYKDLHNIISGTLDGDRLDYVSRDSINSGFSTGIIEYERLISSMKLMKKEDSFLFCPSTSVINTIEDFLMRRWNLYRNIIYHHRVVKTDYLLQVSIEKMAENYLENDCPDTDEDEESYILPYDISGLWKALKIQASVLEEGYSISQWDDAWLMTVLKKEYFEKIVAEPTSDTSLLNKMLTELLTNKKRFASLIKRKEEFSELDKAVAKGLVGNSEPIKVCIDKLKQKNKEIKGKEEFVDIDSFILAVEAMLEKAEKYIRNTSLTDNDGFLLVSISKILNMNKRDNLQEIVAEVIQKYGEGSYFSVFKAPKTGTNKDLFICKKYYEKEEDGIETLKVISDINILLNNDLKFSPFIFIYTDLDKMKMKNFDYKNERKCIGISIGENICSFIIRHLEGI